MCNRKTRAGRVEINGQMQNREKKENEVSNAHATTQNAQREGDLPHVAHIHGWKIKERNRKTANQRETRERNLTLRKPRP